MNIANRNNTPASSQSQRSRSFFEAPPFAEIGSAILAALLCQAPQAASAAEPVWTRFDPRADALDIETVSDREDDGIRVTALTFTSHTIAGRPVRIYGVYARPAVVKDKLPGILFIHGGGQTADEPEAVDMARNGYAVFSHDWKCADTPDKEKHPSRWPFDAEGNRLKADPDYLDAPDWIARRALTLLESRPEVDPARLGVYGFSWGGFHTWTIAATDGRLKAANPSCGMRPSLAEHMPNLRIPILFFNASNDFFASLQTGQELMQAVTVDHWRLIAPNENHNLSGVPREATRAKWFAHYLKDGPPLPEPPRIAVDQSGTAPHVRVHAPSAVACELIFSYGEAPPQDRCWFGRRLAASREGAFDGSLPMRGGLDLWYFANCTYADGTMLSTEYTIRNAAPESAAPPPVDVLYDPAVDGRYPWYFSWKGPVDDHPWHSWGGTTLAVDPDVAGRAALHVAGDSAGKCQPGLFDAFLRGPACPRRRYNGGKAIEVQVFGTRPLTVTVKAHTSGMWNTDKATRAVATRQVNHGTGWATVRIPADAFAREAAPEENLVSFEGIPQFHVEIQSADATVGRPAIGVVRWVP